MGARGNVVVVTEPRNGVVLYTHWGGPRVERELAKVIVRGERLYDPNYFARILFCQLLAGSGDDLQAVVTAPIGYGIGTITAGDVEYDVPVFLPGGSGRPQVAVVPAEEAAQMGVPELVDWADRNNAWQDAQAWAEEHLGVAR